MKQSFKSIVQSPIGNSDHNRVHLLPKYRTQLKSGKVKSTTVKVWDDEMIEVLNTCSDITDWHALLDSAGDIDEATDIINSYIKFFEELHVHSRVVKKFPNDKPWVSRVRP